MHPAAPVLTPERIDAMLSGIAEVCFAGVTEAGDRLKAAPDVEAFERASRALQTVCRNLRQTIALKQRFDREQISLALEQRREAEVQRKEVQHIHRDTVGRHHDRVRSHFADLLWNEYEEDDAQEIFERLDERLGDLSEDGAFLETPVETLIARLSEEFGVGASGDTVEDEAAPETAVLEIAAAPPDLAEPDPAEPDPPFQPPDPPPEPPYIPPWDRPPRPGAVRRNDSGWLGF